MGAPFADPSDVAARWRPLTDLETTQAEALLDDASAYLRVAYPGIDDAVEAGQVDAGIMLAVTANMVKTAMMSGGSGVSQQSETVGPFSQSQTFANPTGNLFITAAMDAMIRGYQPAGMSTRFSNTTRHVEGCGPGYVYGYGW